MRGHVEGARLLLDVPIRSQFDGTEFQSSNCGPTSLAMVLDAFGVASNTFQVRNLANVRQGLVGREDGIALDNLAWIANQAGLRPIGLYSGTGYRPWTVEEVRAEVRHGHPVITLVKYRDLPDAGGTASQGDHYVVVVGLDGADLLINDPAMPGTSGYRRPLTIAELEQGWADSSIPRHGVAFAATDGIHELVLPDPAIVPPPDMGEVIRDDWRQASEPDRVTLEPIIWPDDANTLTEIARSALHHSTPIAAEPVEMSEVGPITGEATTTPAVDLVGSALIPLEKTLAAAPAPVSVPTPERDLGLLSLLSLPLFFLRSAGRLPG